MKSMSAKDAKNEFGSLIDSARLSQSQSRNMEGLSW